MLAWRLCCSCLLALLLTACGTSVEDDRQPGASTTEPTATSAIGTDVTTATTDQTTTVVASTIEATTTGQANNLTNRFVPKVLVEGVTSTLVVEFPDGSSAELNWPTDLVLLSEGVAPYAWAFVPDQHARDFFIRRGQPEEVVGLLGSPRLLAEYSDNKGGQVGFWRPEGWPDVDFLAFQFDSWVVLVYDYRSGFTGGDPMSDEARRLWATNLHGQENDQGFLRLFSDEPLQVAPAGAYPSPMKLTLWSPNGEIDLVPESCDPGFVSLIDDGDAFSHWCHSSGLLSIRIEGHPEYAQEVHDQLLVSNVHVVIGTASDADEG